MTKRIWFWPLMVSLLVAIDQAIKIWVEGHMAYQQRIDLVPFFALFRTHNYGIAFSMLWELGAGLLIAISVAVVCFVLWLWRTSGPDHHLAHIGFALIIGGAIGNMIDRALYGYVVDYFLFFTQDWSFAVFNLADSFITIGAGFIILHELVMWHRAKDD